LLRRAWRVSSPPHQATVHAYWSRSLFPPLPWLLLSSPFFLFRKMDFLLLSICYPRAEEFSSLRHDEKKILPASRCRSVAIESGSPSSHHPAQIPLFLFFRYSPLGFLPTVSSYPNHRPCRRTGFLLVSKPFLPTLKLRRQASIRFL